MITHAMMHVNNADETDRNSAVTRKLRPIRRIDSAAGRDCQMSHD